MKSFSVILVIIIPVASVVLPWNEDEWPEINLLRDVNQTVEENRSENPDIVKLAIELKLNKFVDHLNNTNLINILDHEGYFTVFAPTDEAFEKAPFYCNYIPEKDRMKYLVTRGSHPSSSLTNDQHLRTLLSKRDIRINIYGKIVTASGMRVGKTDFKARNGIIHLLDDITSCGIPRGGAASEIDKCPVLRTFSAAAKKAQLFSSLDAIDPLTILVPPDRAFAKLPSDIKKRILHDVDFLKAVILYHVIPRTWYSAGLRDGQVLKTAEGGKLNVTISSEGVKLNGVVKVTSKDINAINGVIHGIDTVLIPTELMLKLANGTTNDE